MFIKTFQLLIKDSLRHSILTNVYVKRLLTLRSSWWSSFLKSTNWWQKKNNGDVLTSWRLKIMEITYQREALLALISSEKNRCRKKRSRRRILDPEMTPCDQVLETKDVKPSSHTWYYARHSSKPFDEPNRCQKVKFEELRAHSNNVEDEELLLEYNKYILQQPTRL